MIIKGKKEITLIVFTLIVYIILKNDVLITITMKKTKLSTVVTFGMNRMFCIRIGIEWFANRIAMTQNN